MAARTSPGPYTAPIVTTSAVHPAQERARTARTAAMRLVLVVVAALGLVLAVVLGLVFAAVAGGVGLVLGALLAIAVAAGLAAWLLLGADDRLARRLEVTSVADDDEPRLFNLIEGLSAVVGVTPPDVVTQVLMAGPMVLLYFFSIAVAWYFTWRRERREAEEPEEEVW